MIFDYFQQRLILYKRPSASVLHLLSVALIKVGFETHAQFSSIHVQFSTVFFLTSLKNSRSKTLFGDGTFFVSDDRMFLLVIEV